MLDADACYRALAARDRRFDGRFFTGVRTTRIYCRPVCSARLPRRENCRFFRSAAEAEVAGFRPCLRCRPELAPGVASVDASARHAQAAVRLIEDGILEDGGIDTLASRVGVTSRQLRRVFDAEFGVSPVEYAQTQRLLLAKRLLTDTSLSVTDVALASGFRSLRRFNALMRTRYRVSPSRLRREAAPAALPAAMRFELAYRPPYDWDALLGFLAPRAIAGVEHIERSTYTRTLSLRARGAEVRGWICVAHSPRRHAVIVDVSPSLAGAIPAVLSRVRHAFDLACDPAPIVSTLGALAAARPGLRVPGTCDAFELAARAVIGQQVSVAAARTLLGRLAEAFGSPIGAGAPPGLARTFPSPSVMASCADERLRAIGLTASRARTLRDLALAIVAGDIVLEPGVDVEGACRSLETIRGIGPWTSGYIAMRALAWPDAFPDGDLGILHGLNETRASIAKRRSEAWRPWRAYAVMQLWHGPSAA